MERHLEASIETRTPIDEVQAVLRSPAAVLSPDPADPSSRRADLHVDHNGMSIHQEVVVRLRPAAEPSGDAPTWDLTIEPASHARLLPSFRGNLVATPFVGGTTLVLSGRYRPPLGPLGALGDDVVGNHLARQTVDAFLAEFADRVDREADRRFARPGPRPAPYPPDLRARERADERAAVPASHWFG